MSQTLAEIRTSFSADFPDSKLLIAPAGRKIPIPKHLCKPGLNEAEAVFIVNGCKDLPGSQVNLDEFLQQFSPLARVAKAKKFLTSDTIPGTTQPLHLLGSGGSEVNVWGGTNSLPAFRLSELGSLAIRENRQLEPELAARYQNNFSILTAAFFGLTNDELREQMGLIPSDILVRIPDDCFASLVDVLAVDGLILELSSRLGVDPPSAVVIQGDAVSMQSLCLFDEYAAMNPDRIFNADVARLVGTLSSPDHEGHHANYLMTTPGIDRSYQGRDYAAGDYGDNGRERRWEIWYEPEISQFRMESSTGGLKQGESLVFSGDNNRSLSVSLRNGGFMVEAARRAARFNRGNPLEDTGFRVVGEGKRLDGINPQTGQIETGAALSGLTAAINQFFGQLLNE